MIAQSITLSLDEMLAFARLSGLSTPHYLLGDSLRNLDNDVIDEHERNGRQSLIKRGLIISIRTNDVALDDLPVALVGSCIVPKAMLSLVSQGVDGANEVDYINATPELMVRHFKPDAETYQFDLVPGLEPLREHVVTLLAPLHEALLASSAGIAVQVPSADFSRFLTLAREGRHHAACDVLAATGCSVEAVEALQSAIAANPMWLGVVVWGLRSIQPEGGISVMAIPSADGCWLIENADVAGGSVSIRLVDGPTCVAAFIGLLEPLIRTYQPSD